MNFKRIKRLGVLAPWALGWYGVRAFRQTCLNIWFRTFGLYGFRRIGRNVKIDGIPDFIVPCADIRLGNGVRIGKRCVFQGEVDVVIDVGCNVSINDGVFITALYGIKIGSNSSIGEYTSIRDYNHEFRKLGSLMKEQGYSGAAIDIGENVWIGRGCCILAGVTIGRNAVIGANSVVTRPIPANSIAVGAPAKVISLRDDCSNQSEP